MIKKLIHWVVAVAVALLSMFAATGCRTNKDANSAGKGQGVELSGNDGTTGNSAATGLANASLPTRYNALTQSWKAWTDLEVSAKVQITSPTKLNGAGKVYMKRNEWISVSVRMLGFEVATLWVDNDSVVAIDKFHKKYLSESVASIFGTAGVSVGDIQDMLLGRAFLVGKGTATTSFRGMFDLREAENGWYILPKKQPSNYTYGFLASLTANELRGAAIDVDGFGSVSANYSDYFESRTCGWFAQSVSIENSRGKKIAATLKWDLNGAKFNTGLSKSCRIPDGYERIPASALNSLLKSF